MPAAYSIQCPACGAAFLAHHTRPSSITTCPHCAYNAPLAAFQAAGMTSLGSATALPLRRREPRHSQALPAAQPSLASPVTAVPSPPEVSPPSLFPEIPHLNPSPPPPPEPATLTPLRTLPPLTSARPTLLQPEAFLPQTEFAALAQSAQKRSSRPFWLGLFGTLAALSAIAGALWLVWQTRTVENRAASTLPSEEIRPAVRPAAPNLQTGTDPAPPTTPEQVPSMSPLEIDTLSELVLEQGPQVFRQMIASPETRLDCIDQGAKLGLQVAAFFERHPNLTALSFQKIPIAPRDLQTGRSAFMIQVTTSASPQSGALLRYHITPDNQLLLDWPLFEETHENALQNFITTNSTTGSRWFSVGLRRNHGLALDSTQRELHHTFDLQASAKNLLEVPGIVVKDLPVGRFLDQKTEWQTVHLTRLLLRTRTLDSGLKCLEIIDCEGLGLSHTRPTLAPNEVPAISVPTHDIPAFSDKK